MLVATEMIRPWRTLLQRIPSQAVSIFCLKFTMEATRGDILCQPMVTQLKRYRNLTIPENITLVSMDATYLYTSIPHDDGIAACRKI
jgi:hypothetical protein